MRFIALVLVLFLIHLSPASAASPMIVAYKAYSSALEKGDLKEAERQAETAWQEAEKSKNYKSGAVLAYNLATLRIRFLPQKDAIKPAKRAVEMARSAPDGSLDVTNAQVLKALAVLVKQPNKANIKAMRKALDVQGEGEYALNYPMFRAHYELMLAANARGDLRTGMRESKTAQKIFTEMGLDGPKTMASMKVFYASGLLASSKFKKNEEAQAIFQSALDILGPQPYNNPSPLMQNIRVWTMVASAVNSSKGVEGKAIELKFPEYVGAPENCPEVKWIKRNEPRYPSNDAANGYVGAGLVRYSLGEDGRPYDMKVAVEVPQRRFGTAAVKAMETWRAEPLKGAPEACLKNRDMSFMFMLEAPKKFVLEVPKNSLGLSQEIQSF